MVFSSITFLYYFLPVTLLIYYAVPEKWKNAVLFAASFLFYVWGEPKYGLLLLVSVLIGYFGGLRIEGARQGKQQTLLFGYTALLLSFLLIFKYSDFLIENLNAAWSGIAALCGSDTLCGIEIGNGSIPLPKFLLPLGISFYTFQLISYLADVYRGEVAAERNFIRFGAYVTMFPQLVAGPIVRYSSVAGEMQDRRIGWTKLAEGSRRFVCGLAKKVLIADQLSELVEQLSDAAGKGAPGHWMLAAAYTLQVYYDFSGYSDMAIGLGRMLGFTFPENFRYPLAAGSVTEFWRRWHMTLSGWFRDYVYIPLGGSRVLALRWIRNVFVVWGLSGLWHGASWNFVLWGVYFAIFLLLERGAKKLRGKPVNADESRNADRERNIGGHVYTLAVIVISFVIFRYENLQEIWRNITGMFAGGWAVSGTALYEMKSYGVLFLAAAVGAFPLVPRVTGWLDSGKWRRCAKEILQPFVMALLLVLVTAYLIGGSAHPFLYFRF